MLRHNFLITFRNLMRNKSFSFINIFGLSFGLACCLMIYNFIRFEYSYNTSLPNYKNIYQVMNDSSGNKSQIDHTIAEYLQETQSAVKSATSFLVGDVSPKHGDNYYPGKLLLTDSSFFDVFAFDFVRGNSIQAIGPGKVVMNEKMAKEIFGHDDVVGELIELISGDEYMISGVIKNIPINSSIQFDYATIHNSHIMNNNATNNDSRIEPKFVFVRLQNNTKPSSINPDEIVGISTDDFPFLLAMQSLKDLYLNDKYNVSKLEKGNLQLIFIFIGIAFVVLFLAILNYINLSLSRVITRYKEIGLKKTIGATWNRLMSQILFESTLIVLFSFFIAIVITEVTSPMMEVFYGKKIPTAYLHFPDIIIVLTIPFLLGLIAGIYPAIVFSIYTPKKILSGLRMNYSGKSPFIQSLTVFQFTIAIILISTTLVMFMQIDFVKHKDLGFNDELLLRTYIFNKEEVSRDFLINSLNSHPDIMGTTISTGTPGMIGRHSTTNDSDGKMVAEINIDSNFQKVFDIQLLAGRMLLAGDKDKVAYVNKKAMEVLQWDSIEGRTYKGKEIIGIIGNFHTGSLYSDIEPVFLIYDQPTRNQLTIRFTGNNLSETMDFISKQWQEAHPNFPFIYDFYDDYFDDMYKKEERLANLLSTFSILAIVISCLGIIGMVEFTTIKRTKEIGIRKSMGASSGSIIEMLAKSYTIIFFVAALVAIPISWKICSLWLQSFVFKVELGWYHFVLTGFVIAMIAMLTISYQTIKAARRNPVDALRYE